MAGTSSPPTDPSTRSAFSCLNPAGSPGWPLPPPLGAFRVPVSVNGTSGGGAPPPPPHTECKMVEVHGVKVASFTVNGVELICLPQVFELFLKHLVGGAAHRLHQAEEARHQPGGLHRGAGPCAAGTRRHPARSEPLQAHHQSRLRDPVPGLHQRQVSSTELH
ncbi:dachshund a isoform X1 [Lates japonicus]|uniref:Dachshund a isoform X1 n=1 Tax=Lates japonicus TaxID=270547 RepID=A0AAD3NG74_LATJO|nr:dachshund a isoform X1 [Lates japonicus]